MRNAVRYAWLAAISIFVMFLGLSCSSNSSTTYSIEGSVTPTEAGSVTPATGEYDEGADVEIQAEANETWMFSSWEGDVSGTENPIIVTVDDDMVFTAIFEKLQYPLDITVDGGGSVEENIVESKMKDYEIGTEVELNAVADGGWVFVEWQGDLTGSENPQTLTMDDSKSVTAVFERKSYPLTISTDGEGNVSEEVVEEPAKDYAYETVVELTANPSEGWEFARWEGDLESTDNPSEITIDTEKEVTAVFEREGYELTVNVSGEGSVNEELIDEPSKRSYPFNSVVKLTAEPDDGWEFDEWVGDLSGGDNPKEITIDGDKNVTAVFKELSYEINISTDGSGDVSISPDKSSYSYGEEVEITVNPASGWAFANWEGDFEGSADSKTITVESDINATAVFGSTASVRTKDVSDMRVTSVTGGGIVEDDGGLEITERGVCWSEEEDPDLSDSCTQDGNGSGDFTSDITGLRQGYTTYVRAYATNKAGTSFGKNKEFKPGYVSHGYIEGLTPSKDSQFESRSYKLVESNWKGGEDKIWIELNLGATGYVKDVTDDTGRRAGWYFQFNREQGYFHDGSTLIPDDAFDNVDESSNWEINNDPCRIAFGGNWRVPTDNEWASFRIASSSDGGMDSGDRDDAFNSLLRLHAAGAIDSGENLTLRGDYGTYWSSDQFNDSQASFLFIVESNSGVTEGSKSGALPIRCVKD